MFRCHAYVTGFNFTISLVVFSFNPLLVSMMIFLCFLIFLATFHMLLSLLPDGRFDVALLVPLLAPVLSLQHIIFPLCRPCKGLYYMTVITG